jgi:hypothetical protein
MINSRLSYEKERILKAWKIMHKKQN